MKNITNDYDRLFSKFNCAICIINADADLTIFYANGAFYKTLGFTKDEVQYRFANRLSAMLETKVTKKIHDMIAEENPGCLTLEHTLRAKDSASRWFITDINGFYLKEEGQLFFISSNIDQYKSREHIYASIQKQADYLRENGGFDFLEYDCKTKHIRDMKTGHFALETLTVGMPFLTVIEKEGLIASEDWDKFKLEIESISKEGDRSIFETRVKIYDGSFKWCRIYLSCLKYGRRLSVLVTFSDISVEKDATMKYLEETLFYQSVLSDQDGYGHLDVTENRILRVGGVWNLYNEIIDKVSFSVLFEEFKNKVVHKEDREHYSEIMDPGRMITSYQNGISHLEFEFRRFIDQNKMTWMKLTVHLFKHPLTQHIMSLIYIKNIDEIKRQQFNSDYEVQKDQLTGLLNKRSSEFSIKEYMEDMKPKEICALLLFNIRNFNHINESYGYSVGDRILSHMAEIFRKSFRKNDILGRYDGGEFLVFLKDVDDDDSIKKRIENVLDFLQLEIEPSVTGYMGISLLSKKDNYESALDRVKDSLNKAKVQGGNSYHFFHGLTLVSEYLNILSSMEEAAAAQEDYSEYQEFSENLNSMTDSFDIFTGMNGDMAYLVNPKTYELVCGNQAMYKRLGKTVEECRGLTCYELLHNRTRPCPFCRSANWSRDRFYMYRNYNEVLEQEFLIKNKLVTWKNRQVLFAIAVDLSNDKNIVDSMENDTEESAYILGGIQNMQDSDDMSEMMYAALEAIGSFFRAGKVRFWRYYGERDQYVCEHSWDSNAQPEEIGGCPKLPCREQQIFNDWLRARKWSGKFCVESQEAMICNSYDMYAWMKGNRIVNQRWVELFYADTMAGVIEIDNVTINFQNSSFMESFTGFMSNECRKRILAEDMIYTSHHDALTGVLNRSSYEMYLQKFNGDNVKSMAAIVVNINGIKNINAQQGIDIGNNILRKLADIMVLICGKTKVFRMNGDEFLAVIPNEEMEYVESNAQSIQDMVSNENLFTIAIGYCWEDVEKNLDDIVETATRIMKMNKSNFYDSGKLNDNKNRVEILGEILRSIDGHEMEVFLQPKMDIRYNKMVGAEALVRMRDKEKGLIPPAKFIGVLEKNNLIRYVDLFVFEEVCRILEGWLKEGRECPVVSVNFSRVTLMELNLTSTIEQIFNKYQVEKHYIEIEITESFEEIGKSLLYQAAKNIFVAGYSISLDDFGTKYTNLSILSDLDVNVLKLDRSLICSMVESRKNQIILKYIIGMCAELDIDVIAEGVETQEQEDMLKTLGCHLIQGYLYSKPVEVKVFEERFMKD